MTQVLVHYFHVIHTDRENFSNLNLKVKIAIH